MGMLCNYVRTMACIKECGRVLHSRHGLRIHEPANNTYKYRCFGRLVMNEIPGVDLCMHLSISRVEFGRNKTLHLEAHIGNNMAFLQFCNTDIQERVARAVQT